MCGISNWPLGSVFCQVKLHMHALLQHIKMCQHYSAWGMWYCILAHHLKDI